MAPAWPVPPPAADGDREVEILRALSLLQGPAHHHPSGLAAEVLVQGTPVDDDPPGSPAHEHARGGSLAAAGSVAK